MKRLLQILRDCEDLGVRLSPNGANLDVRGPSTPELREELLREKSNVLHYLRTGNCHHELKLEKCAVCSGYVRRLIEGGGGEG